MLVSCPECKHSVSDQAPACPSCGHPLGATTAGPKAVRKATAGVDATAAPEPTAAPETSRPAPTSRREPVLLILSVLTILGCLGTPRFLLPVTGMATLVLAVASLVRKERGAWVASAALLIALVVVGKNLDTEMVGFSDGTHEVGYYLYGSGTSAEVIYTDAQGRIVEATVGLPWMYTVTATDGTGITIAAKNSGDELLTVKLSVDGVEVRRAQRSGKGSVVDVTFRCCRTK